MKVTSQFDVYAAFYDLLYKDKDYKGESQYINRLIGKFSNKDRKETSLLDLACGTGRHLQELYKMGFLTLTGSDISKPMIEMAKKNAEAKQFNIKFFNHSFQTSNRIKQKFDIVISMFSAINYLTTYEDQSKALLNIYKLLNKGGLFIFDYWNGNAVTAHYSPVKVLRKKDGGSEILRVSETSLNLINQDAFVKFSCMYMKDNSKVAEFEEVHHLHYYYFSEMRNLLLSHGFEILSISPFRAFGKEVSSMDWNISVVARKPK